MFKGELFCSSSEITCTQTHQLHKAGELSPTVLVPQEMNSPYHLLMLLLHLGTSESLQVSSVVVGSLF